MPAGVSVNHIRVTQGWSDAQ